MTAFATYEDIEARWKPLTEEERGVAETLLEDAAALILGYGVEPRDGDERQAQALKAASCNMVIRSMQGRDSAVPIGMSQWSQTAGPYSESMTVANPAGDLYLTKGEKRMLGLGAGYIGTISARIGGRP